MTKIICTKNSVKTPRAKIYNMKLHDR